MGRTSPTPPHEVINVRELLGQLREHVGHILGIVEVIESDLDGTDDEPDT